MSANEPTAALPELEEHCHYCDGKGGSWVEGRGDWRRCGMCNGAGYFPTEFGERVLALMRHNFRPMLADAQEPPHE